MPVLGGSARVVPFAEDGAVECVGSDVVDLDRVGPLVSDWLVCCEVDELYRDVKIGYGLGLEMGEG